MEEGLFHNQLFVNHINENAVAAIAHSEGHAEEERVNPLTGAREKVCPRYDSVPCSAHQAVYQSARSGFDASAVPASFVCDPQGKMLAKVPGQAPQAFIDKLNEAQQKLGRPITGSQIQRWMVPLYRGDQKANGGKFKDALKSYRDVAEDEAIPQFVRARAEARLEALSQKAMEAIEAARALPASKAKRELKKLVKELKDLEAPRTAAEAALAELEGGGSD